MLSLQFAFQFAAAFVLIGLLISSLEYLWLVRHGGFSSNGFWSWELMRSDYYLGKSKALKLFDTDLTLEALLIVRVIASTAGIFLVASGQTILSILILLILVNGMLYYRIRWGGEGGDQMTTIILISVAFAHAFPNDPRILQISCLFLAGQITLAYVASGIAKLFGALWRSGDAFVKILSNYSYGRRDFALFLRRCPRLSVTINYVVIGFQITFPLFFVLAEPYYYAFLIGGLLFHFGIAVVMRLHLFVFTFVAIYPCLIVSRSLIWSLLENNAHG